MLSILDTRIKNLNLILSRLREISKRIVRRKKIRGTKSKHSWSYAK